MFTKEKDPCILCLVRGCCNKDEKKCNPLHNWNHRYDWIKRLAALIFAIPISIAMVILTIAVVFVCKEEPFYDDYY